ncbi:hypothetical protein [Nucisporomicrobium flavum]|nr:hypothetical protein [Nucisporomicrobium flavum]
MAQFYALAFADGAAQLDGAPADLWDRFMGWLPRPPVGADGVRRDSSR